MEERVGELRVAGDGPVGVEDVGSGTMGKEQYLLVVAGEQFLDAARELGFFDVRGTDGQVGGQAEGGRLGEPEQVAAGYAGHNGRARYGMESAALQTVRQG